MVQLRSSFHDGIKKVKYEVVFHVDVTSIMYGTSRVEKNKLGLALTMRVTLNPTYNDMWREVSLLAIISNCLFVVITSRHFNVINVQVCDRLSFVIILFHTRVLFTNPIFK